ncbi:ribonuclease domain-containing protein [Gordonia caeni]|uniref:Uncharacterized protein n=1 Tax=Gordonia caeni TaxID=1007097 RepID=A0ABP7PRA7_9ACTN
MTSTPDSPRSARRRLSAVASVVALILVAVLSWWLSTGDTDGSDGTAAGISVSHSAPSSAAPSSAAPAQGPGGQAQAPARVLATLELIDSGDWPEAANAPGTRGGQTFRNNEGLLPATGANGARLRFQEWDVNPKERGRGRDAERIVTANDGSAWYTLDHYRTFVQIRGPAR